MSSEPAVELQDLVRLTRPPKGSVAIAIVREDGRLDSATPWRLSSGYFEIGSVTKTLTGTLLASLACEGVIELDTTVGDILGESSGGAGQITMRELATHTSGLPRLAPNAGKMPFWPRDPYRFYDERRLLHALKEVEIQSRGVLAYSNFGFQLLGYCLSACVGRDFASLLSEHVLQPAGMRDARCQPCERKGLLRGHGSPIIGGRRWHQPLAAAGGVDATIADMARWIQVNVRPDVSPLGSAVTLALQTHFAGKDGVMGLGWSLSGSVAWHSGATGRFQAMVALERAGWGIACISTMSISKSYSLEKLVLGWLKSV